MTVKQNLGSHAPDGSTYVTLADGDGNLSSVTISASDIEIGAVEIKNATTDDRVTVSAVGALKTDAVQSGTWTVQPGNTANTTAWMTKEQRATTGTKSNVASSASSVTVLASNANRLKMAVYNDSTQILYLDLTGGTASSSSYTLQLAPSAWYISEIPGYTGLITGIWASANGNARVTEWT